MRLPSFLPHLKGLHLAEMTVTDQGVTLHLFATRQTAACPACRQRSHRVHSWYDRTIADRPWGGTTVKLRLRVRRFICRAAACPQRIFAEQLPHLVDRYGRRTHQLRDALRQIGLALGGAAGARLAAALGLPVGRTTLLSLIRAAPLPPSPQPTAVGVDEFAWRRGRRFGTIIVDLEHRRPLDLLPDRDADHVAAWLRQQPQITTVARDRSGLYADAATRGAPGAQQVVDRWHLLHNLGEALEQFLLHKRAVLRDAASALAAAPAEAPADPSPAALPALPWQQRAEEAGRQRHAAQLARYEAIHQLHSAGADIAHIARTVGVSRETVYRYLRLPGPPARMRLPARAAALDPYLPYLERRWAEGCRNGKRLWRELRAQGFDRSYSGVARFVARLRRAERAGEPTGATRHATTQPPTPRQVAMLCFRHAQQRTPAQQAYLDHLRQADEAVASAYTLTQDFAAMLRERRGERLDDWLAAAEGCPAPALRRFATGLRGDLNAVRAGLTEPWSNGPTEGFVHKLKLLKRQGYGRAGFDLLRQRVLAA
ncbi:MAG TPA: ISL3 family transposase [Nitrolancea sp.]|nr:ISL3 family transposase [Nitrolancea sp.]